MSIDTWWYIRAYGIFFLFNAFAIIDVLIFSKRKWRINLMEYRHYTSLVFQICGIIYALFLSFIVWDVWERYYDVKKTIQTESLYLVDLYRDAKIFGPEAEEQMQNALQKYLINVIQTEWPHMEKPGIFLKGNELVNNIWAAYIAYTPKTEKDQIWYTESLRKLDELTNARLTRIFNNSSSVGNLRWILLIFGGLFLVSMPSFFKTDVLFINLFLALFLANIIAFLLFIIFSLDHPFTGHVEIDSQPLEYALKTVKPW